MPAGSASGFAPAKIVTGAPSPVTSPEPFRETPITRTALVALSAAATA
jgi:hypothetical protein